MILYIIVQIILLSILFGFWMIDSAYYSMGFLAYQMYPILMLVTVILFKNKVKNSEYLTKIAAILIPMIVWTVGMVVIYNIG